MRGLTQAELAAKAGMARVSIQKIERTGRCLPGTARKLAEALGIEIRALAGDGLIGTGGGQGSPVYILVKGQPGDRDAEWVRVGGGEGEDR